ncbi:hypothetical protein [Maricaulis salignorans]|uniref:Uncharacterized protein n=1 Tax=Maricaulis salignorans TaxID=144026 RepID=A0A1G9LV37_9PROT|nr:hypothetical protein [Maricaulis salignorans]SDL65684.1 hypothetical protein SAMN04488568_101219 [Maricaulis salignorans]
MLSPHPPVALRILLGLCLAAVAPAYAEEPIWTSPLSSSRPACVSAIHVYVRPVGENAVEYLRADAIQDGCVSQTPPGSSAPDLDLTRDARPVDRDLQRGAWAWHSGSWRQDPEAFVLSAMAQGIDHVFISIPIVEGRVDASPALERLISIAHASGIGVSAVEGDPEMVTAAGLQYARGRALAIRQYNLDHPATPLDGLQYDIEPYLLPDYALAPEDMLERWAQSVIALSETYGADVDIVIPFWLPLVPGGPEALSSVRERAARLTVMAYRTAPASILSAAQPSLIWGEAHELPVVIALETGPLEDEHLQVYRPAPQGQLQISQSGSVQEVHLRAETVAGTVDEPAFRYSHTVTAPASRVSFRGDLPALFLTLDEVEPMLNGYDSYDGAAIHGLFQQADPALIRNEP